MHFEVYVDLVEVFLFLRRVEDALALLHEVDPQLEVEVLLLELRHLLLALPHGELGLEGRAGAQLQGVAATVHLQCAGV